jgi:5-methylcytosine-specific restriction endonuclease McrA
VGRARLADWRAKRTRRAPDGVCAGRGSGQRALPIRRSQSNLVRAVRGQNPRIQMNHDYYQRSFRLCARWSAAPDPQAGAQLARRAPPLSGGARSATRRPCPGLFLAVLVLHRQSWVHQGGGVSSHHGRAAAGAVSAGRRLPGRRPPQPHHAGRAARRAGRKHLVEILDRAAGRTEEQVKELVAALRPQPAPADLLRRLPTHRNHSSRSGPELAAASSAPVGALPPSSSSAPLAAVPPSSATAPAPRPTIPAARLEPIAPERHVLRVTVGPAFVADLDAVRAALSHRLPGAGLEEVLHECMRVALRDMERRRRGTGTKTSAREPPAGSRYVPVAVRDEVWRRDGGQCAFVGSTGRRCASRHQLEFHHLDPFALGGPSTAANLALRCRLCCARHKRHYADYRIMPRRGHRPTVTLAGYAA